MSIIPSQNGNISISRDSIVFAEGQSTKSINLLLQGSLDIFISPYEQIEELNEDEIIKNSFRIFTTTQNIFLGANDLFQSGVYSFSCRASEDSTMHILCAKDVSQVKDLINSQKDYGAYLLSSLTALTSSSCMALHKLDYFTKKLCILTDNLAVLYWVLKEDLGFSHTPSCKFLREGLDNLQKLRDKNYSFSSGFEPSLLEKDFSDIFETEYTSAAKINMTKLDYYKHISDLPPELRKSFFGADVNITGYQCTDASGLLAEVQSALKETFNTAAEYFKRLYSETQECIFSEYVQSIVEMKRNGLDSSTVQKILDYIVARISEISEIFENEYCHSIELDPQYLECTYNQAKAPLKNESGPVLNGVDMAGGQGNIPEELTDSALKILQYADIPKERARMFLANLTTFRNLKDKLSLDPDVREIRSSITQIFFEIYGAVYRKASEEKNDSRLYRMFLNYAYMDERLLTPEHTLKLYKLAGESGEPGNYPVYKISDWLTGIYEMDKDPSINQFEQDYFDVFRGKKKQRDVSEKERLEYHNDRSGRLDFEIENLLKSGQKLCYGQISTYFPILCTDMITKDLSKAIVTPQMISESVNKILEVDFSAFHRELSYRNPEKGIEKEFVMKPVVPDFILMPIFGTRAIMWQELTGRNRSTPGRLILPIFTGESLDDLILKLIGNLRWELCRTMMGVAWNDITEKSLTSEYSDYIQFFKKNKDLTEEAKERIKIQIQKNRNMLKDIFTSDYEIWINHESKGAVRLNKVVRSILYKYCPFSKSIRDNLSKQPMYSEIAVQFSNLRAKTARELESRYNRYVKSGIPLDQDLEDNLKFYRDM